MMFVLLKSAPFKISINHTQCVHTIGSNKDHLDFQRICHFSDEIYKSSPSQMSCGWERAPDIKLPFRIFCFSYLPIVRMVGLNTNIDEYCSLEPIAHLRLMSVVLWVWLPAACVFLLTRVASPLLRVAVVRVPVNHLRCPDSWSFFFRGSTGSFCGWKIEVHFGQCAKTPLLSIKRDRGKNVSSGV